MGECFVRHIVKRFLLVHGGMHGAWCWRHVRQRLARVGHDVVTPTLTGLGHRAHLGGADVGLSDHIADVVHCILAEELEDFILVGHSYAGMVITGVADLLGERIAHLVYLDALVPEDGQSAAQLVPRGPDPALLPIDGMLPPIPGYDFGLTHPDDVAWVRRRVTPQSVRTVIEPLTIRNDLSRISRTFIECLRERAGQAQMAGIAAGARRIVPDPSWTHMTIDAGHDCMISHPDDTAQLLIEIAQR